MRILKTLFVFNNKKALPKLTRAQTRNSMSKRKIHSIEEEIKLNPHFDKRFGF